MSGMRQIRRQLIFLLLIVCAAAAQVPQLVEGEFQSKSLGRPMKYRVLLPASYPQADSASDKRYPVLYLLHGLYGDYKNWTELTSVAKYASGMDLIIAMPDGNDSWYTNWNTDPKQKYEDYIVKDFTSEIETKYRVAAARETRYLAGLSMGGYAAMKFALKYPQMFSVAASFSGAFDAPTRLSKEMPAFSEQLTKVYGPANSTTRTENDVYLLIQKADAKALPYLFITCGIDDWLLPANREFVLPLPKQGVRYEYHEWPGKHEWPFWDRSVRLFLECLREHSTTQ